MTRKLKKKANKETYAAGKGQVEPERKAGVVYDLWRSGNGRGKRG